jgi:hypothetical protein
MHALKEPFTAGINNALAFRLPLALRREKQDVWVTIILRVAPVSRS